LGKGFFALKKSLKFDDFRIFYGFFSKFFDFYRFILDMLHCFSYF